MKRSRIRSVVVKVGVAVGRCLKTLTIAIGCSTAAFAQEALVPYRVSEGEIREPLTQHPGDTGRGRETVLGRDANCVLCHVVPGGDPNFSGNIAPPLGGIGQRLSAGQLRLRIVDSMRINPVSVMPAYYRIAGLRQVAPVQQGKPILSAQQIEDVVAFLVTLRN